MHKTHNSDNTKALEVSFFEIKSSDNLPSQTISEEQPEGGSFYFNRVPVYEKSKQKTGCMKFSFLLHFVLHFLHTSAES